MKKKKSPTSKFRFLLSPLDKRIHARFIPSFAISAISRPRSLPPRIDSFKKASNTSNQGRVSFNRIGPSRAFVFLPSTSATSTTKQKWSGSPRPSRQRSSPRHSQAGASTRPQQKMTAGLEAEEAVLQTRSGGFSLRHHLLSLLFCSSSCCLRSPVYSNLGFAHRRGQQMFGVCCFFC